MKKNYLWQALVVTGIVTGLTLSATALGFSFKPNQINPTSSHQQLGSVAALYGGFTARLTATKRAAFYQALGFNRNGELLIKTATAGSKVKLFEFAKYDATAIGLTRNIVDDLIISDQIFQQADLIADLAFSLTLKRNLVTNFILRKSVNPTAQSTLAFGFKPADSDAETTFTPNGWIAASASLHPTVLTKLAITNQANRLIYFAKHNDQAATNGIDADYALILDTKTGQLNLWTKTKLQHPLKLQVRYRTPIIQNRQLLEELVTTKPPPAHIPAPDRAAWRQLRSQRSQAKFAADYYLVTNGFKQQIATHEQTTFFTALNPPQSQRDLTIMINDEGKDWGTFLGAMNEVQARYSMLVTYRNKPAIWLKYLFQHVGYETAAIKAKYGNEYQDFKLTNLKQLFVGWSLKARLKLSLIMTNIGDPNLAKKLLGDVSVVEFIASFDVVNNRFSLEPTNKNSLNQIVPIQRSNFHQEFGLKITDPNLDAPKINHLGTDGTLFISIDPTNGRISLNTTVDAGLEVNDQLTVKFEYMEPIVKKI